MNVTQEQAEQFVNIYNALLTISVRGEDVKLMAQILMMMENLGNSIKIVEEPKKEEQKGE